MFAECLRNVWGMGRGRNRGETFVGCMRNVCEMYAKCGAKCRFVMLDRLDRLDMCYGNSYKSVSFCHVMSIKLHKIIKCQFLACYGQFL